MKIIYVIGAPGAKKEALMKRLVEQYQLSHLSVGDCLLKYISTKNRYGEVIEMILDDDRKVLPSELIRYVLDPEVRRLDKIGRPILLDGAPRGLDQARDLERMVSGGGHTSVSFERFINPLQKLKTIYQWKVLAPIMAIVFLHSEESAKRNFMSQHWDPADERQRFTVDEQGWRDEAGRYRDLEWKFEDRYVAFENKDQGWPALEDKLIMDGIPFVKVDTDGEPEESYRILCERLDDADVWDGKGP